MRESNERREKRQMGHPNRNTRFGSKHTHTHTHTHTCRDTAKGLDEGGLERGHLLVGGLPTDPTLHSRALVVEG